MDAVASSHDCGEAKEAAERREKAVVHVTIPPASRDASCQEQREREVERQKREEKRRHFGSVCCNMASEHTTHTVVVRLM